MGDSTPAVRMFAPWTERPLAFACVALALVVLVWKTIGLNFVPGWEEMFGGVGAQYPRRAVPLSPAWSLGYLLMYGVLGTAATCAGLVVSLRRGPLDRRAGPVVSRCARLLGAFHVLIGVHHTVWAATSGRWGHLALEQFDVPGLYVIGGIVGFATGLHGLRLLRSGAEDPTHRIVRSKIVVDGVSVLTFVSVFVCFPMNLLGLPRIEVLERIAWSLVFIGPALWLLADAIISRPGGRRSDVSRA